MLDAISDFWKPSKKNDPEEGVDITSLQKGAVVGFGFLPQVLLSGKRLPISAVNTYEFGEDRLTSFVLAAGADTDISMIVADGEGEKYIALSRRIPFSERMRIFDNATLLSLLENANQKRLQSKNAEGEWGEWIAPQYKKAIHGLKGQLISGDFRNVARLPESVNGQQFSYTLLVSNNNEYALEIEQYDDNRMEIYATVYRRMSDIGEIQSAYQQRYTNDLEAVANQAKEVKTVSLSTEQDNQPIARPIEPKAVPTLESENNAAPDVPKQLPDMDAIPAKAATNDQKKRKEKNDSQPNPSNGIKRKPFPTLTEALGNITEKTDDPAEPIITEEKEKKIEKTEKAEKNEQAAHTIEQTDAEESIPESTVLPTSEEIVQEAPAVEETVKLQAEATPYPFKPLELPPENHTSSSEDSSHTIETINPLKEPIDMSPYNPSFATATKEESNSNQPQPQPARAIANEPISTEYAAIECDLRVANKIIDEAIRNEIRLSDVVRRIVELPVAQPEAVQIPVTLSDEDYKLLSIRYAIASDDKEAIKTRIVEEMGNFSGV